MSTTASFKLNSHVLKLKADVLEDPDSWLPTNLRNKLGYKGPFVWDKFITYISKPTVQASIRACIPVSIPASLVKAFRAYGLIDRGHLEKAITTYLTRRYQLLSVFDADVRHFVTKWPRRWQALTDTSVRDGIIEAYTQLAPRAPTSFRFVIGYYRGDPDNDPDDKRPAATKKSLEALLRKPATWTRFHNIFHNQPIYDSDNKHYPFRLGLIKPPHITKIKLLSAPTHNPTFWEKVTQKHAGWIYHPDLVAVVDVKNIPLIKVGAKPQRPMDGSFGDWVVAHHMHSTLSGNEWYDRMIKSPTTRQTEIKKKPFHGSIHLLQMGERIMPNYRNFAKESF